MSAKKITPPPADENSNGKAKSDFPKFTLEDSLKVAKVIYENNGGKPLPPIDIAQGLEKSPGSSDFRVQLSASIKYGLTTGSYNQEKVAITSLALQILEPQNAAEKNAASLQAAFTPPTFRGVFEHFKGKKLPELEFFKNTLVREFQVPREQADKCVTIFTSNATGLGLVRTLSTGKWLSGSITNAAPVETKTEDEQLEDEATTETEETALPPVPVKTTETKPEQKNAIFLGHGKNHKPLEQLKTILDQFKIPYKTAIQEPNSFRPISQKVADTMRDCGAAILVFTADEELKDKDGNAIWRPSENVIYELGAASVLYGGKIIIFKEEAVVFPSNFKDIGYIKFDKDSLSSKTSELFAELISFGLIKVSVGT